MEDVKRFAGKQTRCIEALEKIKLKRKQAQEGKNRPRGTSAPTNLKVSKGKTLVKAEQVRPPSGGRRGEGVGEGAGEGAGGGCAALFRLGAS